MPTLPNESVSVYSHPYRPELACLRVWLNRHNYHPHAVETIVGHAAAYGTLEGLVRAQWLDAADEAEAEGIFVTGMEPVPQVSHEWDDPGVWIDAQSTIEALADARRLDERIAALADDMPRRHTLEERAEFARTVAAFYRHQS